ncbi:MAG: ribonuclease III [Eubacterium sp.]|nr:ribonuclease III [Eubacterium sp.]
MNFNIDDLQNTIGYSFSDEKLLVNALTHKSYNINKAYSDCVDNERLEYLGDAVLELVTSDFLYKNYKDMSEGEMTKLRSSLVCEPALATDAREINLPDFLYMGKGEENTGGRNRDSIVSDAMEALIAAIYLDGGLDAATKFINSFVLNDIEHKQTFFDSKTVLQERVDSTNLGTLKYEIVKESGPDHNKVFDAVVKLNDEVVGKGSGNTKKQAEQKAATDALSKINY